MALAEAGPLGLIILDLNLGEENGAMLLKFLKHNHPGVPILLFTGVEHDDGEVRRLLEMGAEALQQLKKLEAMGHVNN